VKSQEFFNYDFGFAAGIPFLSHKKNEAAIFEAGVGGDSLLSL
jgi:hypothetical protein